MFYRCISMGILLGMACATGCGHRTCKEQCQAAFEDKSCEEFQEDYGFNLETCEEVCTEANQIAKDSGCKNQMEEYYRCQDRAFNKFCHYTGNPGKCEKEWSVMTNCFQKYCCKNSEAESCLLYSTWDC